MSLSAILFFIRETFIGLKRSGLMTIIAIATVTITLIILGLFLLISVNLGKVTDDIVSRLEIRLFVKSNLKLEEIKSFQQKLNNVQGIQKVTFVNNADAWTSFKSSYDHLNLESYITENPLPHSLVLKLDRYQDIKPIILYLKRF